MVSRQTLRIVRASVRRDRFDRSQTGLTESGGPDRRVATGLACKCEGNDDHAFAGLLELPYRPGIPSRASGTGGRSKFATAGSFAARSLNGHHAPLMREFLIHTWL